MSIARAPLSGSMHAHLYINGIERFTLVKFHLLIRVIIK